MKSQIYNIIKENLLDFDILKSKTSNKYYFIIGVNGQKYDSMFYNVYLSPFGLEFEPKYFNNFFTPIFYSFDIIFIYEFSIYKNC